MNPIVEKTVNVLWNFPILENSSDSIQVEGVVDNSNSEPKEDSALIEQVNYLERLGLQIQETLNQFDENFLNNLLLLMKKVVKKVIHKEIDIDNSLFYDMVVSLHDKFNKNNDSCVIVISEDDRFILENNASFSHLTVEVDPLLGKGDFIIKNKLSEIEAILEHRLTTLFGV